MDNPGEKSATPFPESSEETESKELSESDLKQVTGGAIDTSPGIVQKAIKKID
jgi:bacteriocin-like protein